MNLQQLRFVREAARRGLNLSEVAKALHTSQPGVSKAILELEHELGVDIFSRHGKRLRLRRALNLSPGRSNALTALRGARLLPAKLRGAI